MSEDDIEENPSRRHTIDDWTGRFGGEKLQSKHESSSEDYVKLGSGKHNWVKWLLTILSLLFLFWFFSSFFF